MQFESTITPFPGGHARDNRIYFDRLELNRIMDLYGRMVASGLWRDYALDFENERAVFSAFRRAAERPEYTIEKHPKLRRKQGMWLLRSEVGGIVKRGQELAGVLAPIERRLLKVVED